MYWLEGPEEGAEGLVVLVDTSRLEGPGLYVLARAAEWAADGEKVTVWRGPSMPDETVPRAGLLETECRTVLVDPDGFYQCLEPTLAFDEELLEFIEKQAETILNERANERAAETYSYLGDDLIDDYQGKVWAVATFGDATAVNGEVVLRRPRPPRGYVETERGGRVPTGEEMEIEKGDLVDPIIWAAKKELGRDIYPDLIRAVLDHLWKKDYIYWTSDSGDSEIWASKRAVKAYEKAEEERERRRLERIRKESEEARRREEEERQIRIRRGGWPRSVEWSPRGKLPGER